MENRVPLFFLAVIFSVCFINVEAQAKTDSVSFKGAKGTRGYISTKGGDLTLYRDLTKEGSNKTLKTADIVVRFLRLTELNDQKLTVTDKNNKTHTMTSFEKQTFNCQDSYNTTMAYSSSVKADCWRCSTDLLDTFAPATFRLSACVIQNNGTIVQEQEVSNVTEGQVKLSFEIIKSWPWCDVNCTGGVGKFLDLSLSIKLPSGFKRAMNANRTKMDNQPARFELGSGVNVEFSAMSLVDSKWLKLVDNTPVLTQNNETDTVTMRFNRFESALLYDPTFDIGSHAFDPNSSGRLEVISLPLLFLITMVTVCVTSFRA